MDIKGIIKLILIEDEVSQNMRDFGEEAQVTFSEATRLIRKDKELMQKIYQLIDKYKLRKIK